MGKPQGDGSNQSALKRMRASLQTAGVLAGSQPRKGSKKYQKRLAKLARENPEQLVRNAKERHEKLDAISTLYNPFDIKTNKPLKVKAVGRKVKGVRGAPTLSKQVGLENRKKTLLVEWQNRHRSGGLIDRRFGENNPHLTPEEKMMERFAREREVESRNRNIFNLEEEELTHLGQSLGAMDDADMNDDRNLGTRDDGSNRNNGYIDPNVVASDHFGGFGLETVDGQYSGGDGNPTNKSKSEVMQEVIAKSKFHKQERQRQQAEDMDAINELDSELKEIRGLLMTGEAVDAAKSDVSASESDSDDDAQDGTDAMNVANGSDSDDADDDYNRYLRELTFERRAPATDRFKTEEELLVEEKKRLERAERHRIRRMAGEPSDTESDGESATEGQSVDPMDALSATKTTAGPQGDDLLGTTMRSTKEVDFGQLVGPGLQMQASEVVASADETGDHGDGSETTSASASAGEHSSASEESESSGSESGMEDGSDLDLPPASHGQFDQAGIYDSDNDVVPLPVPPTVSSNRPLSSVPAECTPAVDAQDDGLPFTFPAPSSYQDLAQLLKGRTVTQQATIIQRLRALYPVKLAPENKEKLRNLAQALYVHIYTITADQPTPTLATLNVFVHHLVELAPMYPDLLGELAHQQVKSFHKALLDRLRLHSGPSPMALNAAFPKVTDMVQFKLISQLMSASDFKHPVVTPLQGILAQYLAQYPAQTPRDVVCGLFICHLMLDMQRQAQRLVPEVLNYLGQVLHALYDPQLPVTNGTNQATAAHGLSSLAAEQTSSTAAPRSSQQQWGFPTPAMPIARLQQHLFMALHTTAVDWSSVAYRKLPLFALIADFRAVGLPANQFKLSVLGTAVQLLGQAADLYRENPSFPELFGPMQDYLQAFTGTTTGVTQLPAALVTVMTAVETTVRVHLNHALQSRAAFPLQLQRHRPIPLPSFVPKFEDNYSLDRHYDADRQQAELKRLKHKHTRELRGAMRELRKDAQFLAAERLRVVKERDQEYNTKIRRIMGALGDQEGDLRASDRMTKQLKRKHLKLTIRR